MPSKSKKQAKLMRAVAHGWKPSRIKGPTRAVAKEFVSADKRRDEVTGYRYGGYADGMDEYAGGGMMGYEGGGPAEYQYGGGVPYRGVPPQRGMIGRGGGGGGYGRPGGVPGTIGGYGGYQGPGRSPLGGGSGPFMPPGGQGGMADRGGALRQMMQRMQSRRGGPGGGVIGNTGPILSPYEQAEGRMRGLPEGGPGGGVMGPRQGPPGRGGLTPGGPGYNPGGPGTWVGRGGIPGGGMPGTMGEGPGGRLEMEGRARQAKRGMMQGRGGPRGRMMSQAQNRFGALTQGAPGGGSFGKPMPGRRIAPPPGKYPGGGNPMTGGRNPMIRGAGRRGGRGGRGGRGMYR